MAERVGGRVVATAAGFLAAGLLGLPSGAAAAPVATPPQAAAPTAGEWWWTAMGVDELHAQGRGKGVEVAVIDGPIDPDVPDLAGKVASSTTECLDPAAVSTPRPRSPRVAGPDAEHATSMAGLIAGTGKGNGPGGRGLRGIAPEATIRHYAVLFADAKAEDGYACGIDFPDGDDVDRAVGRAITAAAKDGADVINVSLVTGYSQEIEDGLLAAYRAGAVVVAGTGNARDAPSGRASATAWCSSTPSAGTVWRPTSRPRARTSRSRRPARTSWPAATTTRDGAARPPRRAPPSPRPW